MFDQNGDGFITVEDCKKMIMKVDVDGDGMVNYKEFKQMMKGGGFSTLG